MALNTFNLAELVILGLFLWAWVVGATYLVWAGLVKGRMISRWAISYWLTLSIVVIIGKLVLLEYNLHLSRTESQTEFWTRMLHLVFFEGELSVFTGAVYAQSDQVWRLLFYPTVVIVSLISTAPLLAFGVSPKHS